MQPHSRLALNDEGFAFDPTTGDSFMLNGTGLVILRGLREGKGNCEIAQALTSEYEVTPENAESDVADFLARLRSFGLVRG